ncbi:MAG: S-layer homology domain-containing protein, partial [Clostridiales bacterium]|nr:S-layer homology domain-containing protein [Clostridiales bacterium]
MKRSLALLLTLALLLLLSPFSVFADAAQGNQAANELNLAKQAGLVTDKVTKDYQKNISREEFCELIVKLYEKLTGKAAAAGADIFTDTDNADILKAYSLGIIKGISADKFGPGNSITRQEICVMLTRCIKTAISAADTTSFKNNTFTDSEKIASWASPSVNYTFDKSVIKAVDGNRFDPLGKVTCEQAVTMIYKIYHSQAYFSSGSLKAGAGSGEIVFPDELFPLEGFNKVHDNPCARVLVLESDIKVAIVSVELVNIPAEGIEICKKIVNEKTGTPVENIWIHATHA